MYPIALDPETFKRLFRPPVSADVRMARARDGIQRALSAIMDAKEITILEAMEVLYGWYENDYHSDCFEIRTVAALRLFVLDEMSQELLDAETALEMN